MNRRKFIKRTFWGITGLGIFSGLYAWQIEPFWLEFVKIKMPIKNLPNDLVGKTLMQISDIHIGNRFDYNFVIDSFKKAKEFNPDFVVYTGDFVSTYKDEVQYEKLEKTLNNSVKGKLGTLGILGNHDYGRNWSQKEVADKVTEMAKSNGIQILRNENIEVKGLNFIGFDDFWGLNFNPEKAMNGFVKSLIGLILLGLMLLSAYTWVMLSWSYADGERAGYVQKFSSRGYLCKTWEGELAMVSMPGTMSEKFFFSVRDDAVAQKINANLGKKVALKYEQHIGLPTSCFGETEYFVIDLLVLDQS
jgi:3',5'-cyclic AMP phosphodiesterase CpdA